jgi:hypothetical protein
MRNDAKAGEEKDPVEQALGYLKRIRAGNIGLLYIFKAHKSGSLVDVSPVIVCDFSV